MLGQLISGSSLPTWTGSEITERWASAEVIFSRSATSKVRVAGPLVSPAVTLTVVAVVSPVLSMPSGAATILSVVVSTTGSPSGSST